MTSRTAVIIGASHAAAQLTASLRQEGWDGDIVVVGDEGYLPYQHPPLSKTFLSGDKTVADLYIRPAAFYEKNHIHFRQGRVTAIDRDQQRLTLDDGSTLAYDKLALCLGARDQFERFLALVGGVELEHQPRRLGAAEQRCFSAGEGLFVVGIRAENLAEILMDRRCVVDDQNAPVGLDGRSFHSLSSVARRESSGIAPVSWVACTMLPAFSNSAACWLLTARLK